MRLSRLVSYALAVFSAGTAIVLFSALLGSLNDFRQTTAASHAARAHAAWVVAQVSLSLERGLTQIVLDDGRETPQVVKQRLFNQRMTTDTLLREARALASSNDPTPATRTFLSKSAAIVDGLHAIRAEIDRHLAARSDDRSDQLNRSLLGDLLSVVEETSIIREYLHVIEGDHSVHSTALISMHERVERAREFADRARLPIAIWLLQPANMRSDRSERVRHDLAGATRAWRRFKVIASNIALSDSLRSAIDAADALFFDQYRRTLEGFDFRQDSGVDAGARPDDSAFDVFFSESSAALDSVEKIADIISAEVIAYWDARSARAEAELYLYMALFAGLVAALTGFYLFVNERLVKRIQTATAVLSAVADGDLDARAEARPGDLYEIGALHKALERFRASLKSAREAEVQAKTDSLTGLPNRRGLDDLLNGVAGAPIGANDVFGFLDLDDFKPVNDMFGHEVGDIVLREIARRIQTSPSGSSEVWRLGGDEFGIVWRGLADEDHALWQAEHLLDALSQPIRHKGRDIVVAASIGLARREASFVNPHEIVSAADFAMFVAKNRPTNKVEFSNRETGAREFNITSRREILSALDNEEFEPFFQPQHDMATGRLVGFEVLARWRRPDGEVLTPGSFMSLVEHQQLQSRVDILMLEKAVQTIGRWRETFCDVPKVSVNMSEETLASEECRDQILSLFANHPERLGNLVIEVTEDALIDRSANAIRKTLEAFAKSGVDLSMDDFGTGYGSFRHLKEYRFDEVKIDRSFVNSMSTETASHVIIEGFIAIAKGLNARVVAEGVETAEQFAALSALGCDIAQGYHFGRPSPVDSADAIMAAHNAAQIRAAG